MAKKKNADPKPRQVSGCTQCHAPLHFYRGIVTVNGKSLRRVPIAYCAACRRYYTNEASLRNQKITIDNYPVRWLGQSQSKRKKRIPGQDGLRDSRPNDVKSGAVQHTVEPKRISEQSHDTHEPPDFMKDITLLQIPVFQNTMRSCPFCGTAFKKMFPVRYHAYQEHEPTVMHAYARVCDRCRAVMMDDGQSNEVRNQIKEKQIHTIDAKNYKSPQDIMKAALEQPVYKAASGEQYVLLPFEKDLDKPENLSTVKKKIKIYAHKCDCAGCRRKYRQNPIRNRTAMVQTISGRTIGVNVMFCAGCGQYYMNLKAFQQYRKMHQGLMFECVFHLIFQLRTAHGWGLHQTQS